MAVIRITWINSTTPETIGHKVYRNDTELLFDTPVGDGIKEYTDNAAPDGVETKYEIQAYTSTAESTDEVDGENMDTIIT